MDLRETAVKSIQKATGLPIKQIQEILEIPPDPKLGDLAFPCFVLAKKLKKAPSQIAKELQTKIDLPKGFKSAEVAGPYLNFFYDQSKLAEDVLKTSLDKKFGESNKYKGQQVIVDMIGLNPNKAGHIGHIRNGCVSDTLISCMQLIGYKTVKQSFVNDMGVPTAMVFWAVRNLKSKLPKKIGILKKEDQWQGRIYEMMQKLIKDPKIKKSVEKLHLTLETNKDMKLVKEQRDFIDACVKAQSKTWDRLHCSLDLYIHESDIIRSGLINAALKKLKAAGGAYTEQEGLNKGAVYLKLNNFKFFQGLRNPDKLLVRPDGRAAYTGKDVPMQLWKVGATPDLFKYKVIFKSGKHKEWATDNISGKKNKLGFNKNQKCIYVIGAEQEYVIAVDKYSLKIIGLEKEFENTYHLAYGLVGFGGKAKIASREGASGLTADEILNKAAQLALKEVNKRNSKLSKTKKDQLAESIGTGAVRYYLTKVDPIKFIDFNYNQALSFEGDTGPYLQYSLVRASKILKKAEQKPTLDVDFSKLSSPTEQAIVKHIAKFPETIEKAAEQYSPHFIANYSYELAQMFARFYEKNRVIGAKKEVEKARLLLVKAFHQTLKKSLNLLGIEEVEVM